MFPENPPFSKNPSSQKSTFITKKQKPEIISQFYTPNATKSSQKRRNYY
jgi:hypothetical protein